MSKPISPTRWLLLALTSLALSLSWFGCSKEPQNVTAPVIAPQEQAALSKAYAQMQSVMAIQSHHTDRLLATPGVVGTATTLLPDGRYAVKVLTKAPGLEKQLPTTLDHTAVVVEVVGEIRALAFTGRERPISAGVSIGNIKECAAGTFGAVVVNDAGTQYVLSNNHVLARQNKAKIGEDIVQPGRYENNCTTSTADVFADLSKFVSIKFSPSASNKVDAAIAQIRSGMISGCATTKCGWTPSATTRTAALNMPVKKCGRTTEETHGEVTGVNVTVIVQYGVGKYARFVGQIQIGPAGFSDAGDSGSLIVTDDAANNPVGLLFAGSSTTTIANPINDVLSAFGVTICGN